MASSNQPNGLRQLLAQVLKNPAYAAYVSDTLNEVDGLGVAALGGFTEVVIETGVYQSTAGGGVVLSSSNTRALSFLADDNGANIGASVRNTLARTLLTVDQSGGSIRSLMGQLKLLTGVDVTNGIYTAVQGYLELVGTHVSQTGATFSCFDASVEITTSLTIDSGGEFAGAHVETTGAGTITNNGTCAGVLVDKASGAASWPDGILIDGPSVVMGLRVGKFASSAATSSAVLFTTIQNIYSDGQASTVEIHGGSSTDLGSGYAAKCLRARHVVQCTTAAHETYGVMGQLVVKDTTLTHLHAGVIGTFEGHTSGVVSTPAYRYGTACVQGRIGGGGAITATTPICGFSAIFNGASLASGSSVAYAVTNTAAGEWDYVMAVTHAGTGVDNGVEIVNGVAGDTGSEGTVGYDALMKIQIGSTDYYIALFDVGSVTGEA